MDAPNLIIDFDSTFVSVEALDELARIVLNHHPRKNQLLKELSELTKQGMEGKIGFAESLEQRMDMFRPNKQHLEQLINLLRHSVTASAMRNRAFFQNQSARIYIISGGFVDYIWPTVSEYGLQPSHILANKFIWGNDNQITGYDKSCPLAHNDGKAEQLKLMSLKGPVYAVGDGYTDYKIKALGQADKFWAFTENITRPTAVKHADMVLSSFDQIAELSITGTANFGT